MKVHSKEMALPNWDEMGDVQRIEFFKQNGFLVVKNLLSPNEIAELRAEADDLERRELAKLKANVDAPDECYVLAIHKANYVSDTIQRYVLHKAVGEVLKDICTAHLAYPSRGVKNGYSILFIKPGDSPGQAWHQDETYIPTRDRSLTAVSIAIDSNTKDNGCLWVVPGSHRAGILYPKKAHGETGQFDEYEECHGFDDSIVAPIELTPGSAVFMNGYLLHGSRRNNSGGNRRTLVSHYMSSETLFPWGDCDNGQTIATFDNRKVRMVCGEDPHAWKGYAQMNDDSYTRSPTAQ